MVLTLISLSREYNFKLKVSEETEKQKSLSCDCVLITKLAILALAFDPCFPTPFRTSFIQYYDKITRFIYCTVKQSFSFVVLVMMPSDQAFASLMTSDISQRPFFAAILSGNSRMCHRSSPSTSPCLVSSAYPIFILEAVFASQFFKAALSELDFGVGLRQTFSRVTLWGVKLDGFR